MILHEHTHTLVAGRVWRCRCESKESAKMFGFASLLFLTVSSVYLHEVF